MAESYLDYPEIPICCPTKRCRDCGEEHSLSLFYSYDKGPRYKNKVLDNRCKRCFKAYREAKRNPGYWRKRQLALYGLTVADFENLLAQQNGKCVICKEATGSSRGPLEVEHNHETNVVRGLACGRCNKAIAWYENFQIFPFKHEILDYLGKSL